MVEQSNRIFTYRDASGSLHLQRKETVPSGVTLCMYCNPTDVVETLCQDNGQFSVSLPMRCYNPMKPMATRIRDSECSGSLYAVGYTIDGKNLELYRTCFDAGQGRVLYSQSDVYYKTFCKCTPENHSYYIFFITNVLKFQGGPSWNLWLMRQSSTSNQTTTFVCDRSNKVLSTSGLSKKKWSMCF